MKYCLESAIPSNHCLFFAPLLATLAYSGVAILEHTASDNIQHKKISAGLAMYASQIVNIIVSVYSCKIEMLDITENNQHCKKIA